MSLDASGLTLSVAGRRLVTDLSLSVAPGEVWAVLGPNGSGKTTLLHALAGLRAPDTGRVQLSEAGTPNACEVGILLQDEPVPFWGTVYEYVLLGRYPRAASRLGFGPEDSAAARSALAAAGLAAYAERRCDTLSGGERQRARIAQLLAQSPRYFLLDEPLQNLDLRHQAAVLDRFAALAAAGAHGVVMVLHDTLWPARRCTHALLLHEDGSVVAGPVASVVTQSNLERLYGCRLRTIADGEAQVFVLHV